MSGRPLPTSPSAWLAEIAEAWQRAREVQEMLPLLDDAGEAVDDSGDLHLIAPELALQMRGLPPARQPVADLAATASRASHAGDATLDDPLLGFAFAYLTSHHGLDLVDAGTVRSVMSHLGSHGDELRSRAGERGDRLRDALEYDAASAPDPIEWLGSDDDARLQAVLDYHGGDRGSEHELHAALHAAVENQVAAAELPVREVIERLQREGLDRHQAVHAVAEVLLQHMGDLMTLAADVESACQERYFAALERLDAASWLSR